MSNRSGVNRRELLKTLGIGAAALTMSPFLSRALLADETSTAAGPTKKVLFFTKSSGFQHSVITRKSADDLSNA